VPERSQRLLAEQHHANFLHRTGLIEKAAYFANRNLGGFRHGITIGAGADGGERNGLEVPLGGKLEALTVARRQFVCLTLFPSPVYRAYGMEDVLGLQPARFGHDSLAGRAFSHFCADTIEFRHDTGSGGPMDSAVHSGSAREARIGSVYDGVGFDQGDVALFELYRFAGDRFRLAHTELCHNEKPLSMAIDWFPLWLSLEVAALATLISLLLGIWLAWLLANKNFPGKDILDALTTLPLALPPTVLGYYLLVVIGRASWIGQAWEKVTGSPLIFTWRAAVIASTLHAIPLLVKSSRAALENVDRSYEKAARSLGASEWRLFWRVSIPLARRPVAAATALAFARSLGDFGATLMIAGDIPRRTQTAAIAIYDAVESGNTLAARTLVIVISIVTAAIVYLANRLEQRRHGIA
jgi:molybdate transport system permease protein